MVNAETQTLLDVIDVAKGRIDVVPAYRRAIGIIGYTPETRAEDWGVINRAIIDKWSKSGLLWIKERAWKS